jgi:hypothetical protein
MEVSGQLYDPAALSPGVITRYALFMRPGGRQEPARTLWSREISFSRCLETKHFLDFPLHSVIRRTD